MINKKNKHSFSLLIALSVFAIFGVYQIVYAHGPPTASNLQLNNSSEAINKIETGEFYEEMSNLMNKYGIEHPCHAP